MNCNPIPFGITAVSCIFPVNRQERIVRTLNKITSETIIDLCCNYFKVELAILISDSRTREAVDCRKLSIYLIKKYLPFYSLKRVGEIFSRDHSTVIFNIRTCEDLIETDPKMKQAYYDLTEMIEKFIDPV